jgi:hypothetical protein
MKTITCIILALAMAFFTSCEGVPGPPGEDGLDGDSFIGAVFEIEGDFTPANYFRLHFTFPDKTKVYESDVVLVYILWEQLPGNSGKLLDVWRLLPQTIVLEEGVLQYNFDFTYTDVQIFLGGSINLQSLLPSEALDQIFRIVVVPAIFAKNNVLKAGDYNLIINSLGLSSKKIERFQMVESIK